MAAGILILCFALGVWVYERVETKQAENELKNFYGQKLTFKAKIVADPELRSSRMHVVVQPELVSEGRVLLILQEKKDVRYADVLLVEGKLERPENFDNFHYEEFLAKDEIYAFMREPVLEAQERKAYEHQGEKAMAAIFLLKATFRETLETYLSSSHSSLMIEMLLGDKDVMSKELAQGLNATGLRHIIAISGMHIALLTMYIMPLLIFAGLWRQQAFYVTLLLTIFYVVLTGLQASAMRAGIMAGMFLLGQHISRQYAALRALIFVAAGMLLFNPFLLTRDIGFELSFLAVLGMILLAPLLLSFMPQKMPTRQLIAITFAAQVFTFPLLIWNFGQISLVTIVSNILVVPVVPLLMGLGFLLMAIGTIIPFFAFLLSFPVALLTEYIMWVVRVLSTLPFAVMQTENISFVWLIFLYIPAALFYWKFRKRREILIQY